METVRQTIREVLTGAQNPAVLFSGGKDSLLLLAIAREVRQDIAAVWFRTGEPDVELRRVLRDWDVPTFSWAPADVYLLADGVNTSLVQEYDFGTACMPIISDIRSGNSCVFNHQRDRRPEMYTDFDVLLWGAKDCDTHWIKGDGTLPTDGFELGRARVYAPLRHMTDEQVYSAIIDLGLPYTVQPDELPLCTACLQAGDGKVYCLAVDQPIDRVNWDPALSLATFRNRFNLEVPDGPSIR